MSDQDKLERVKSLWDFQRNTNPTRNQPQTNPTHNSNKFHYFFDLPPELREQIIEHICYHPGGIFIRNGLDISTQGVPESTFGDLFNDHLTFNPYVVAPPVNLMLACAELYRTASGVYYGRNTFHLRLVNQRRQKVVEHDRLGNQKLVSDQGKVRKLLLGKSALQSDGDMQSSKDPRLRLRHVVVHIDRFGGPYLEKKLIPALGYMVLNGTLRRLEVEVSLGNQNLNWQISPQMAPLFQIQQQAIRRTTTDLTGTRR